MHPDIDHSWLAPATRVNQGQPQPAPSTSQCLVIAAMPTPLAIFAFNRPQHTARLLRALSRCDRLSDVCVYIYCDGPRTPDDAQLVSATRAIVRDWAETHPTMIVESPRNLGLAGSITTAVTELVCGHQRVIVLEDDLVPAVDFLAFMLAGLDRYEKEPSVMQIAGCLLTDQIERKEDGLFLPLTTTWGWATWQRAWARFDPDGIKLTQNDLSTAYKNKEFLHRFSVGGAADYMSMLKDRLSGRNQSWGILWWYTVARDSGLVLYPTRSLIWNGGFDGSGTHCGGGKPFSPLPPSSFCGRRLAGLSLPDHICSDADALAKTRPFLAPWAGPNHGEHQASIAHLLMGRWLARLRRLAYSYARRRDV